MRITDAKTVLLTGPSSNDPFILQARPVRGAAFIEVYTDCDIVGLGETYVGYHFPEVVPHIVEYFKPVLVGQDCEDIPELWDRMYRCHNYWCRVGLATGVLTGIEAALWDLKGKTLGVPVYELLGGRKHDKLLGYATGGPSNYSEERLAEKIDFYLSLGFRALKLGAGALRSDGTFHVSADASEAADFEAEKMEFVRSKLGSEIQVALDGHMGNSPGPTWDLCTAQAVMKAVERYNLLFFEEPLHYTNIDGYAELCRSTAVRIAGGECLNGYCEWQMFVDRDAFDLGQPDAAFIGGLWEFMRVADLLNHRGRQLATHAWGAGGSLMQNVHCAFASANTLAVEVAPAWGPLHSEIMTDSFVMQDGMILPPEKPGLGIALSDETRKRYPFIPGSGEFTGVPGMNLAERDAITLGRIEEAHGTLDAKGAISA